MENNDITQFNEDAEIVTAQITKPLDIMSYLPSSADTGANLSIIDFLKRPFAIARGTLGTTDTVSTFPIYSMPDYAFSQAQYSNKLQGVFGFRGDMVFKIQINGNPFQQGRYMLAWVPTGGAAASASPTTFWYITHGFTLSQRSQLPHVELDISCDTTAILKVPFVSALEYFPVGATNNTTKLGSTGILQLFPYAALQSPSGSNTVPYTLWVNFENIELVGATYPQSNIGFDKNPTEVEQKSAGIAPISGALAKFSGAAKILGQIPLLSSVAAPVGWATEILSKAALSLGWSRPLNLEPYMRVERAIHPYHANFDAPDNSLPLSYSCKNQVEVLPGFGGTDVDEMSFGYFLSVPTWIATISWPETGMIDQNLWTTKLSPGQFLTTATDTGRTLTNFTPMAFISNMFQFWRGGFVFTFKIVKTPMHSGRLVVAFNPLETMVVAGSTYLTTENQRFYTHREVIDIRETSEFTVTVPYTSVQAFRACSTADNIDSMGQLTLSILDPLVAPGVVANNVQIIIEVAAASDMEFAVPTGSIWCPVTDVTPQGNICFSQCSTLNTTTESPQNVHYERLTNEAIYNGGCFDTYPQSNIGFSKGDANPCQKMDVVIGNGTARTDNLMHSRACIGEKISSFRQMLKVPCILPYNNSNIDHTLYRTMLPFAISWFVNETAEKFTYLGVDIYSMLGSMYVMSRGGVRIKAIPFYNGVPNAYWTAYYTPYPAGSTGLTDWFFARSSDMLGKTTPENYCKAPTVVGDIHLNGGFDIQVPMYHFQHARTNVEQGSGVDYAYELTNCASRNFLNIKCDQTADAGGFQYYRSGADDCSFAGFVSIPPMRQIPPVI